MRTIRAFGLASFLIFAFGARAEQQCPAFSGEWCNGGPYTIEGLKGKAVLIYLFEAKCPNCAGKWPAINQIPKTFENDPTVLIAVCPGNTKAAVDAYVKANKVTWPVMADSSRVFEKQLIEMKLISQEISLQNIMQVCVVNADDEIDFGNWNDFAGSLRHVLNTAKWKIDPATIPETLKKAWRAVEFNQMSVAAPLIAQALKSADAKTKEAAQSLQAVVQPALAAAKEKEQAVNQVKIDRAPTYVLTDGSRVKALSVIDADDTVVIKTADGKIMTVQKTDIKEIIKP